MIRGLLGLASFTQQMHFRFIHIVFVASFSSSVLSGSSQDGGSRVGYPFTCGGLSGLSPGQVTMDSSALDICGQGLVWTSVSLSLT